MKKYILILIMILLFTGCVNSNKIMKCQKEITTDNNLIIKNEAEIEYNDEKVLSLKLIQIGDLSKTTYNNDTFINNIVASSKNDDEEISKIKGVKSKTEKIANGYKNTKEINYEELDEKEVKNYPNTFYGVKTIKIKDYQEKYFKDYTCKEEK